LRRSRWIITSINLNMDSKGESQTCSAIAARPTTSPADVEVLHSLALGLTAQGDTDMVLDLGDMSATDSTGLGAIIEVRRVLRDGHVYLLQPPERLRTHLSVTHVE
jgi:ABC-type transporter Mla MlaB component